MAKLWIFLTLVTFLTLASTKSVGQTQKLEGQTDVTRLYTKATQIVKSQYLSLTIQEVASLKVFTQNLELQMNQKVAKILNLDPIPPNLNDIFNDVIQNGGLNSFDVSKIL
jgi:hypothetical protein